MDVPRLEPAHQRLLWLLSVACFSEGYDFALLIVALPQVRDEFGLSHVQADLLIGLLYLGALPALMFGRWADRHGRRNVLLLAIVGYVVAAVVTAASPVIAMFVACQFVARCFIATQVAVAWTMAAEDLPAQRRGFAFGILALASALGTGTASIVQAAVLAPLDASWRWLYILALPFLFVALVLKRSLPESQRYLSVDRQILAPQPASLLLRAPFFRLLGVVCIAVFLVNLTTEATIFSIDFLENSRGQGASTANLLIVIAGAATLPVLTLAGRLSDRIGRRRVCIVGLLVQIAGLLLFFIVARGAVALGICLALAYVGIFAAWTTGAGFAVELFPTTLRAAASSAAAMAKLLGQSASFVVAAGVRSVTDGSAATISVLAVGPLIGAVLIARFLPETSQRELTDVVDEPLPVAIAPLL